MKKNQTTLLAVVLAFFAFATFTPDANAIPPNKVPGTAYHDGKFDHPGVSACTTCGAKRDSKCAECSVCDDCKSKRQSKERASKKGQDRKPYWKKKIGI